MLDGQFDFPLRGQVLPTLLHRDGQMSDLVGFLDSNDGYYGPGAVMSTFLGNHDVPRAIEHALDTPLFDPWDGGKEPRVGEPAAAADDARTRSSALAVGVHAAVHDARHPDDLLRRRVSA